jgi:hypothetical protein
VPTRGLKPTTTPIFRPTLFSISWRNRQQKSRPRNRINCAHPSPWCVLRQKGATIKRPSPNRVFLWHARGWPSLYHILFTVVSRNSDISYSRSRYFCAVRSPAIVFLATLWAVGMSFASEKAEKIAGDKKIQFPPALIGGFYVVMERLRVTTPVDRDKEFIPLGFIRRTEPRKFAGKWTEYVVAMPNSMVEPDLNGRVMRDIDRGIRTLMGTKADAYIILFESNGGVFIRYREDQSDETVFRADALENIQELKLTDFVTATKEWSDSVSSPSSAVKIVGLKSNKGNLSAQELALAVISRASRRPPHVDLSYKPLTLIPVTPFSADTTSNSGAFMRFSIPIGYPNTILYALSLIDEELEDARLHDGTGSKTRSLISEKQTLLNGLQEFDDH